MDNKTAPTPTLTALSIIQQQFCLIKLAAEVWVIERLQVESILAGGPGTIEYYKLKTGRLLVDRLLETLPIKSTPTKEFKQFLVSPATHMYDAVAFNPIAQPATTLNYWTSPSLTAKPGDWEGLEAFLLKVICDNNSVLYRYLINYFAHMLQKPEEKPGVAIVLLGGQGTGKGTVFRLLQAIWSRTTLQVSDVDEVVGKYNAALERNYVICMDEALFNGDKRSMERLKSLITEPTCRVEQKYQPSRSIESCHRFFAASNHNHFAKIGKDDRRFVFLRVSSVHQGDLNYYARIHKLIEDPIVISALMHDLLATDLRGFNVRQRPKTQEHLQQKLQSLSGFDRFWYEVLHTGIFLGGWDHARIGKEVTKWEQSIFITTERLIDCYKEYDKNASRYNPVQSQQVASQLLLLCPGAKSTRQNQHRGYQLPSIDRARREFELLIDGKPVWEELEEKLAA